MLIERLILEFQSNDTTTDTGNDTAENPIAKFDNLRHFVDVVAAEDCPCAVVRVDVSRFATASSQQIESGAHSPLADEVPAVQRNPPGRPHLLRSGRSRLQRVGEELQSQARHASSFEMVNQLDQTLELLSPREWDVLLLMLRAKTCKEMGSELHIGLPTVAKHRARVLKRFAVRDHIELFQLLNNLISRGRPSQPQATAPRETAGY